MKMHKIIFPIYIAMFIFGMIDKSWAVDYIFDDEFNSNSLSPAWMALDVYDNVNNERQCYKPSQISVSNGLNITTAAQNTECSSTRKSFASGAIVWAPPFTFKYGTVEYRAKFAGGKGSWPAVWLLGYQCQPSAPNVYNAPDCKWPHAGSNEIDITEVKLGNFTRPWQNVFGEDGDWSSCRPDISDVTQNFHTYTFTWTPKSLTWYIDGVQTCQNTDPAFIPNTPMYMIINTAVGGYGGGELVRKSSFPQTTQITYVRVTPYKSN